MSDEIREGNEKIARFEGYQYGHQHLRGYMVHPNDPRDMFFKLSAAKYHTSWNWLIPVVQKIDALWMQYDIGDWRTDEDQYKYFDVLALPIGTPIMDVWENVVKFIDWYNQKK
jgi:hypothetical protein